MRIVHCKAAFLASVAFSVLTVGIGDATAGGFAVREQSTYGQGMSFAGMAAGGALSGMFWNPAVMTQFPGLAFEAGFAGILPNSTQSPGVGTFPYLAFGGVDNSGDSALVPSSYTSWQVAPNLCVGLSVNAPFGLSVSFPNLWAGRLYAGDTSLKTYNATPSVAYRFTDWLSFGAGVQIMYSKADLTTGLPGLAPPFPFFNISGDGWAFGFTAGVTITPLPGTEIGIGWRSSLDVEIDGTMALSATLPGSTPGSVSTTVKLPDIVTFGLRQRLTENFTVMGTVEWSNWSRIGTATVSTPGGAATVLGGAVTLPFQYDDGWFFAIGGEYIYSDQLTFRAGFGYEISPISDRVRTPRLPDNDRYWASAGMSYKMAPNVSIDLAYTHIFVKETPINITAASGNPWLISVPGLGPLPYVGTADSSVDIISLGLRYQLAPPPPALVTKG
jgi:long-chain fatty acid transport protein